MTLLVNRLMKKKELYEYHFETIHSYPYDFILQLEPLDHYLKSKR